MINNMDNKIIKYFSVVDFKKYMMSIGYVSYDYNCFEMCIERLNNSNICVISIGEPNEWIHIDNNYDLWANGVNNHWLPSSDSVLNIEFGDVGNYDNMKYKTAITDEQAIEIVKFIERNSHKTEFIIHCSAGISRSGAVSAWIYDYFKCKGVDVVIEPEYPSTPNYYIKGKLKDIYYANSQSN